MYKTGGKHSSFIISMPPAFGFQKRLQLFVSSIQSTLSPDSAGCNKSHMGTPLIRGPCHTSGLQSQSPRGPLHPNELDLK